LAKIIANSYGISGWKKQLKAAGASN